MWRKWQIWFCLLLCLLVGKSSQFYFWHGGTIEDPALDEVSGLAASKKYDDVYWAINDSGNSANLFAIQKNGKAIRTVSIKGGPYRDIEALGYGKCAFAENCLFIADIGDNDRERRRARILVLPEPEPSQISIAPTQTIFIQYDFGPINAESILIRPKDGAIFIIEKLAFSQKGKSARIFKLPTISPEKKEANFILSETAKIASQTKSGISIGTITDAVFKNSGSGFYFRDYSNVFYVDQNEFDQKTLEPIQIWSPMMRQSEAIAIANNDFELVITSEGLHSRIRTINLGAKNNDRK